MAAKKAAKTDKKRAKPWDTDAAAAERYLAAQETLARLLAAGPVRETPAQTKSAAKKSEPERKQASGTTKSKKTNQSDHINSSAAPLTTNLRTWRAALRALSRAPLKVRWGIGK